MQVGHAANRASTVRRARTVELATVGRELVVYADGERIGPMPLRCEAVPGAVRVLA